MQKIVELFMNEGDREGLTALYEKTNDEIVKLLINWIDTYEEIEEGEETNEFFMYDDLLSIIFKKYKLNEE